MNIEVNTIGETKINTRLVLSPPRDMILHRSRSKAASGNAALKRNQKHTGEPTSKSD